MPDMPDMQMSEKIEKSDISNNLNRYTTTITFSSAIKNIVNTGRFGDCV